MQSSGFIGFIDKIETKLTIYDFAMLITPISTNLQYTLIALNFFCILSPCSYKYMPA
jgi:hypothetical protein